VAEQRVRRLWGKRKGKSKVFQSGWEQTGRTIRKRLTKKKVKNSGWLNAPDAKSVESQAKSKQVTKKPLLNRRGRIKKKARTGELREEGHVVVTLHLKAELQGGGEMHHAA